MNILVTGANGFLGHHLIENLINDGHHVFAIVRDLKKVEFISPRLHLIKADLAHPLFIDDAIIEKLDIAIHTAGLVHTFDNKEFYRVNSDGTKNLIQALKTKSDLKFILISSLAARGPNELLENGEDFPVSDYGKSKKAAEKILNDIAPLSWTKIKIRPPYGDWA